MMVHVQFRLDGHRRRCLAMLADHEQRSVSEMMRDAVDLYLAQRGAPLHPAVPDGEVEEAHRSLDGWDAPTAAGLPVVDDLDQIA